MLATCSISKVKFSGTASLIFCLASFSIASSFFFTAVTLACKTSGNLAKIPFLATTSDNGTNTLAILPQTFAASVLILEIRHFSLLSAAWAAARAMASFFAFCFASSRSFFELFFFFFFFFELFFFFLFVFFLRSGEGLLLLELLELLLLLLSFSASVSPGCCACSSSSCTGCCCRASFSSCLGDATFWVSNLSISSWIISCLFAWLHETMPTE